MENTAVVVARALRQLIDEFINLAIYLSIYLIFICTPRRSYIHLAKEKKKK